MFRALEQQREDEALRRRLRQQEALEDEENRITLGKLHSLRLSRGQGPQMEAEAL
jgi:hypothetical protein